VRAGTPWYRYFRKYREFLVEYDLGEPTQLSFDEARELVVDVIVRNRWYLQSYETRPKFVKRMNSYTSMRELIEHTVYGTVWY